MHRSTSAMHTRLIVNPAAGDRAQGQWLLEQAGTTRMPGVEVITTDAAGDLADYARQAATDPPRRIIIAGGDGTISRVINDLAPHFAGCELAIVPIGTANDFARTAAIPPDAEAALDLALHGQSRPIDMIRSQQPGGEPHYLINAATGGFSRAAGGQADETRKGFWGPLAYLRSAVEQLADVPEYAMTLYLDDEPALAASGCALIVANGRYAGGGMPLVPSAALGSGHLEVVAVTADDAISRLWLTGQFVAGRHLEVETGLIHRHARRVHVEAEPTLHFSTDGEPIGASPITFETMPQALRLVVPAAGGA